MRFTGTLTTWNDERGFGFLTPVQGGQTIFVHIKDFPSGTGRPTVGQVLSFEVLTGADGRKRARALQYPAIGRPKHSAQRNARLEAPAPWTPARALAIPVFLGLYASVIVRWGFYPPVLWTYLGMSTLAFFAYVFDKSAARSGRWRTAEKSLHLLSLAGGWPGALLAQQLLRHKTRKPGFVFVFWCSVVANMGALVAWHAGLFSLARWAGTH